MFFERIDCEFCFGDMSVMMSKLVILIRNINNI